MFWFLTRKQSRAPNMSKKVEMVLAETMVVVPEAESIEESRSSSVRKTGVLMLHRRVEYAQVALRVLSGMAAAVALTLMVLAKEDATVNVYGFELPVHSKWSFSNSFEYLVGATAAVAGHSLLQLLIGLLRLCRGSPLVPSTRHAWLMFASDQVFAYAMMSAGSAASGVTNLNRNGVKHSALPKFCNWLHSFCNHVAVSIVFTFLGSFLLAVSAILDIIWLTHK